MHKPIAKHLGFHCIHLSFEPNLVPLTPTFIVGDYR